jgi:hypothetical protein
MLQLQRGCGGGCRNGLLVRRRRLPQRWRLAGALAEAGGIAVGRYGGAQQAGSFAADLFNLKVRRRPLAPRNICRRRWHWWRWQWWGGQ